jgi:hypothetical protein
MCLVADSGGKSLLSVPRPPDIASAYLRVESTLHLIQYQTRNSAYLTRDSDIYFRPKISIFFGHKPIIQLLSYLLYIPYQGYYIKSILLHRSRHNCAGKSMIRTPLRLLRSCFQLACVQPGAGCLRPHLPFCPRLLSSLVDQPNSSEMTTVNTSDRLADLRKLMVRDKIDIYGIF